MPIDLTQTSITTTDETLSKIGILLLAFICSKSTMETVTRSGVFIVNFEHISHIVLVFPLLTLNK